MKRSTLVLAGLAGLLVAGIGLGGTGWLTRPHAGPGRSDLGSASSDERAGDYQYRKCQPRHWRDCMLYR